MGDRIRDMLSIFTSVYFRFIIVGIANTVFSILLFLIFVHLSKDRFLFFALLFSYGISILVGHYLQRGLVWVSSGSYIEELRRYVFLGVINLVTNFFLLEFILKFLTIKPIYIQAPLAVCLAALSFFVQKRCVFTKR